MTNAQRVFDLTMALMDEMSESGQTDTADTKEYKNRTLNILNVLRGELYPYSDTYAEAEAAGRRPIAEVIEDFEGAIALDDYICQSVLPYGLAAHLLLDENPNSASFFQQKYDELKSMLARGLPQESVEIEDVYSGGYYPHNDFGWW